MRLPHSPRIAVALAGVAVTALAVTGCSTATSAADDGTIRIVASTSAYGSIASAIGGDLVDVTSIMSDPSQDPHSFEADAQVQLSLSKADIVIENGGGYDDFVDTLLTGAGNSGVVLLNAAEISGYDQKPAEGEFNEHLWYDFPTIEKVAARITAELTTLDSAAADTFRANAAAFTTQLQALEAKEATIKSTSAGAGVAITEPVPLYMLEAAGLVNKTPEAFSEAIEEGSDVSPAVLRDTLALFSDHTVKLLAYNEQTTGAETEAVLTAAKDAGIAIVPVTETLPKGVDYIQWQSDNLDALAAALG
ncbi:metal ABC transporter solute-binding protein, Zn/Mn family [Glaciihabitans sp. dw_435]|uniref:metal ABC transporter solute-binding protein, Zn/Mn family n=1 Tax=Glaciihabitans sp. dw_435 TaxID=2720081 RepID=UPI001BD6DE85|nr:zinc ABC transporter substrate-binding protein [Glaciihabitans sp. dw_435]